MCANCHNYVAICTLCLPVMLACANQLLTVSKVNTSAVFSEFYFPEIRTLLHSHEDCKVALVNKLRPDVKIKQKVAYGIV